MHLLSDALVSAGVVVAGVIISYTHWYYIDPLIGVIVMIVILISTWSLLKDSFMMAVDAVPSTVNIDEVKEAIIKVKGVINVSHLHVWALSTTENALTVHVTVDNQLPFTSKVSVITNIKHELQHHSINHSTIELDNSVNECDDIPLKS